MDRAFKLPSLPDSLFFPLMLLVAGGMVLLAFSAGFGRPPSGPIGGGGTDYKLIAVEGDQLSRMESGIDYAKLERIGEGDDMLMRVTAFFESLSDQPERGPHFKIASDLETRFSNFTLEVTITARASPVRGASTMLVNYSTGNQGNSGWLNFRLKEDFEDYRFTYDVPPSQPGTSGYDYLAIKPEVPAKTRSLDIKRIEFRPIARWRKSRPG